MIDRARLLAPRTQFGVLLEPGPAELRALLAAPSAADTTDLRVLDRPLSAWRDSLRARLGLRGRLVGSGHQLEFFHAGVLAKLLAADALAGLHGATPVFIAADSDASKQTRVHAPVSSAAGWQRVEVRVPGADGRTPTESLAPLPRAEWELFFGALASRCDAGARQTLREFAAPALARDACTLGDAVAEGTLSTLRALGLRPHVSLRMSELAETPEFRALAAHCFLEHAKLAREYNTAIDEYRRRYGVRTAGRPLPPLLVADGRWESPFWLLRRGEPERRRAFIGVSGSRLVLWAGTQRVCEFDPGELRHSGGWASAGSPLPDGWLLRPRALLLSAFVRCCVLDLFIHGIGGATYDEITDTFFARVFGAAPPPIACATATVYAPVALAALADAAPEDGPHLRRELEFNPQRVLRDVPAGLAAAKQELIAHAEALRRDSARARDQRRTAYLRIRSANHDLRTADPVGVQDVLDRARRADQRRGDAAIAADRELFFGLLPFDSLRELQQRIAMRA